MEGLVVAILFLPSKRGSSASTGWEGVVSRGAASNEGIEAWSSSCGGGRMDFRSLQEPSWAEK